MARSQNRDITLLAREERNGEALFQGHIVVREKSPIQELADLQGRTFCFGAPTSTLGTVLPKKLLLDAGFTPREIHVKYITGHDDVARAILGGKADAGCVKHGTYTDPDFREGLRSLQVVRNLTKPWVARSGLEPWIADTIREALLSLDGKSTAHRKALGAMTEGRDRLTGFTTTAPAEFDFIHEALERIQTVWPASRATGVPGMKERA
jgi:phosphonate transport system substrate-binding protein